MSKLNIILGLIFVLLVSVFLSSPQKIYASNTIFQDNFDNPNLSKWVVGSNNCLFEGAPAKWEVIDGKLGMKIDGGTCYSDIAPSNEIWNSSENNYTVDFDMILVSGTDHHFAFRYTNTNDWYNFHIQSPSNIIFQRMSEAATGNLIRGNFSNQQTIHFELILNNDHLTVYRDINPKILIYDNPQMGNAYPTGKIALQATAGGDPISETYFDNIVVKSLDDNQNPSPTISPTPTQFNLNVPIIKQTTKPWKTQIYDSANKWANLNYTIESWGCALVSGAMILNYYGINKLPNGIKLDPGTLNTWLKNQKDGYLANGWLNWLSLSRLSKLAKSINHIQNFDALQYLKINATDNLLLTTDIQKLQPDILEEPGHFVVAKGINAQTFNINDPYYDRNTLDEGYSNTYKSIGRFVPSFTDLSYIMIVSNPDLRISAKDKNDILVGEGFTQEPIDNDKDVLQKNSPIEIFYIPAPSENEYLVSFLSSKNTIYNLSFYLYDKQGNVNVSNQSIFTLVGKKYEFKITFNKNNSKFSKSLRIITFQNLIDDIIFAKYQKFIFPVNSDKLLNIINKARESYENNKVKLAKTYLENTMNYMELLKKYNLINHEAYKTIVYDLSYLMRGL